MRILRQSIVSYEKSPSISNVWILHIITNEKTVDISNVRTMGAHRQKDTYQTYGSREVCIMSSRPRKLVVTFILCMYVELDWVRENPSLPFIEYKSSAQRRYCCCLVTVELLDSPASSSVVHLCTWVEKGYWVLEHLKREGHFMRTLSYGTIGSKNLEILIHLIHLSWLPSMILKNDIALFLFYELHFSHAAFEILVFYFRCLHPQPRAKAQ